MGKLLLGHTVRKQKVRSAKAVSDVKATTVCPKGLDLFYIVTYYTKWVKTSWTYSRHTTRTEDRMTKKKS